jgi:hypothetical protein
MVCWRDGSDLVKYVMEVYAKRARMTLLDILHWCLHSFEGLGLARDGLAL